MPPTSEDKHLQPLWIRQAVPLTLLVFAGSFALWWPDIITNTDEGMYTYQAAALLGGQTRVAVLEPWSGQTSWVFPAQYPALTAILQMPAMALWGWRGAYLQPLLGVVIAVLASAHWLRRWQLDRHFALLWLVFLPFVVLARVATSDVIATAWVTLALAAFVEGQARDASVQRRAPWLLAGFLAGSSLAFREMGPLVPVVFFAGALLRRQPGWWWLLVGGVAGVALRPLTSLWVYGNPWYLKESLPDWWGLRHLRANFLPDVALLSVLLPGGLPALLAYRGRLRAEMLTAGLLLIGVHLCYQFADGAGGWFGAVIGGRFFNLAVPVLIVAVADAAQRLQQAGVAVALWPWAQRGLVAAALAVAALLHPAMAHWTRSHREVRDAFCQHVPEGAVTLINTSVVGKYISPLSCARTLVDLNPASLARLDALVARGYPLYVGVVERNDSADWLARSANTLHWVDQLRARYPLEPVYRGPDGWQRLQLWRVAAARSADNTVR